jgi:hypothetical protein
MLQEHEYHGKDPKGVKHRGLNTRIQERDEARRGKTRGARSTHHDRERHHHLTQVRGPREEVKPILLPSCIAPRRLTWYNKFWLQSSSLKKQSQIWLSNLAKGRTSDPSAQDSCTSFYRGHGPPSPHRLGEGVATSTLKEWYSCPTTTIDGPRP